MKNQGSLMQNKIIYQLPLKLIYTAPEIILK